MLILNVHIVQTMMSLYPQNLKITIERDVTEALITCITTTRKETSGINRENPIQRLLSQNLTLMQNKFVPL